MASIRAAGAEDFVAMDAVQRASGRALCTGWYDEGLLDAWIGRPKPQRYQRGVAAGDEYFVSVEDERLVCFGGINRDRGTVRALFVAPDHAGRGLATAMMECLLDRLRRAGVREVSVESSLNAQGFYQRFGFVEVGRDRMRLDNGLAMEAVLMSTVLADNTSASPSKRPLRAE